MILRKIQRRKAIKPNGNLSAYSDKLQQILLSRGIESEEALDYSLSGLLSPSGLKNMGAASEHLFSAIRNEKSILIIGDFDADGATSTVVMMNSLRLLGAKNVSFLVPDRFTFGYGLSVKLVEHAAKSKPGLIVTVDNGIANIDGVKRANELNIPVIITDHHLAAEQLPQALSIVNPNQPGDEFASKHMAGVGVAFYLMLALRSLMRSEGWFESQSIDEPNLAGLLDIVALGTVADVVILDKNNRILVEQGLKRIRSGLACYGIKALLSVARRDYKKCQSSDLGFSVAPRLNASGRLENMSIGILCLMSESLAEAEQYAEQLDRLNRERKNIEQDMLVQANSDIKSYFEHHTLPAGEQRPDALCLYDPSWHQGVVGILASRIKEKLNRPVIIFARDNDEKSSLIKGSARSVSGVHIRDVLALVDARHPELIEKFGGHAMAAGLSIKQNNFQQFADYFCDATKKYLNGAMIKDEIITDSGLSDEELSLDFAREIRMLGPWGQGFTEPLFDDEFRVVSRKIVATDHLKLQLEKYGKTIDAIYFRCPENCWAERGDSVHLVYKIDINEFRNIETLQLMIEQLDIL